VGPGVPRIAAHDPLDWGVDRHSCGWILIGAYYYGPAERTRTKRSSCATRWPTVDARSTPPSATATSTGTPRQRSSGPGSSTVTTVLYDLHTAMTPTSPTSAASTPSPPPADDIKSASHGPHLGAQHAVRPPHLGTAVERGDIDRRVGGAIVRAACVAWHRVVWGDRDVFAGRPSLRRVRLPYRSGVGGLRSTGARPSRR
jgi:hypothetical protein